MKKLINRNFTLFASGRIVSLLGSGIQNIAIPLYILRTTGSGLIMGTYVLVQILPQIILMPISGVLGDHFNRKRIMVMTDFLSGGVSLCLAVAMMRGELSLTVIFVAQIALSSFLCLFEASTSAMVPEILKKEELLKGNSILGSIDSLAYIIGPILGASLFGLVGLKIIFLIDGISFIFSAASECFIDYIPQSKNTAKLDFQKAKEDLRQGFSFLGNSIGIIYLISFAAVANLFGIAAISVLLPFIFIEGIGFSDSQFGLLQSSIMLGILIGNLFLSFVSHRIGKRQIITGGLIAEAAIFTVMGIFFYPRVVVLFDGSGQILFVIFVLFLVFFGISNAFLKTSIQTNMQTMIPNHLRGRVMAAYAFSMQVVAPIGVFIMGVLLDIVKYYHLFMISSIMIIVATLVFLMKAPEQSFDPGWINQEKSVNK